MPSSKRKTDDRVTVDNVIGSAVNPESGMTETLDIPKGTPASSLPAHVVEQLGSHVWVSQAELDALEHAGDGLEGLDTTGQTDVTDEFGEALRARVPGEGGDEVEVPDLHPADRLSDE